MAYKNILECALSQVGTKESPAGSNNVKYNTWYYGRPVSGDWYPWCAVFVSWCFYETGIYDRIDGVRNKAGCDPYMRWAKSSNIFSSKPKVGALVLFDWDHDNSADHIGIVKEIVSNNVIKTVEGNTAIGNDSNGGEVMIRTRYASDIIGYIHVDGNAPAIKPVPNPILTFSRIAGLNRYNTSQATVTTWQNKNSGVTLVSGETFADALSASYLAYQKHAPILLTSASALEGTITYIKSRKNTENINNIKNVYIIGGESAIPKKAEEELQDFNVVRLSGQNRYDTNLAVLSAVDTPNAQIVIASGKNFPDGLCAGLIPRPVMIVGDELTTAQVAYLKDRRFTTFYVLGGTGAVSEKVTNTLSGLGEVQRISGSNRYATAVEVAKKFFPNSNTAIFASGKDFPDGLSAANLINGPLLLVDSSNFVTAQRYITKLATRKQLKSVQVVGGTGAVSDYAANMALTKLQDIGVSEPKR